MQSTFAVQRQTAVTLYFESRQSLSLQGRHATVTINHSMTWSHTQMPTVALTYPVLRPMIRVPLLRIHP